MGPNGTGLVVVGQATRSVTPEIAVLTLGAQTIGPTPSVALRENAAFILRIGHALVAKGIDQSDLQTTGMSVLPQPAPAGGLGQVQMLAGYQATSLMSVSLRDRDLNGIGDVLDAAIAAGANYSVGISFRVRDESVARRAVLEAAVRDARASAEVMAAAAGKQLGGLVAVAEESTVFPWGGGIGGPGGTFGAALGGTVVGAMPAAPGELSIGVRVRVTFELRG